MLQPSSDFGGELNNYEYYCHDFAVIFPIFPRSFLDFVDFLP